MVGIIRSEVFFAINISDFNGFFPIKPPGTGDFLCIKEDHHDL
jgi:hypothetical protein